MQKMIQAVAALEMATFSDPWSERILQDTLKYDYNRIVVLKDDGVCTEIREFQNEAAESGLEGVDHSTSIIGYSIYRTIAGETELCRIAIEKSKRGQGLSRILMDELVQSSGESIFLEVRSMNTPARNLYVQYGFVETGLRKKYYEAPEDDAVLMTRSDALGAGN